MADIEGFITRLSQSNDDSDVHFLHLLNESIDVILKSFREYEISTQLALSFNGGKDSTVLLHLLRYCLFKHTSQNSSKVNHSLNAIPGNLGDLLPVVYFETTDNFSEVLDFMKETSDQFKFTLEHVPSFFEGLQLLVSRGLKGIFLGTRFSDPHGSNLSFETETTNGWPQCIRISPLLRWEHHHIWRFLRECNLPFCDLYRRGYTSLGSMVDSKPNPALRKGTSKSIDSEGLVAIDTNTSNIDEEYDPAWMLPSSVSERDGRR
jgi:FAD synthetase